MIFMVLITWCQKLCAASDLMNIFISAINFWTVQKEHLIFYLECGSSNKRLGRNWSLWGCDFALTLVAWEAGSGIFIKLILSYIISVLNISNKLATGMCIQILWIKFLPAVNIFISNYQCYLLSCMNALLGQSSHFVFIQRDLFSLYIFVLCS